MSACTASLLASIPPPQEPPKGINSRKYTLYNGIRRTPDDLGLYRRIRYSGIHHNQHVARLGLKAGLITDNAMVVADRKRREEKERVESLTTVVMVWPRWTFRGWDPGTRYQTTLDLSVVCQDVKMNPSSLFPGHTGGMLLYPETKPAFLAILGSREMSFINYYLTRHNSHVQCQGAHES